MTDDDDLQRYQPGGAKRVATEPLQCPECLRVIRAGVPGTMCAEGHRPQRMLQVVRVDTSEGIVVTVGDRPRRIEAGAALAGHQATRYRLALRRQAANRVRKGKGAQVMPEIRPGSCVRCEGWGVVGPGRLRCEDCHGSGDA